MWIWRFRSMAGAAWKWTCFARHRASPSNWTAASIWATWTHTGETVAKTLCFKRTATWSSGSLPKMSANISIRFWMRSCGLYHIKTPEPEVGFPDLSHLDRGLADKDVVDKDLIKQFTFAGGMWEFCGNRFKRCT